MKHSYLALSIVILSSAVAADAQTTTQPTPVTLNSSPSRQIGQPLLIPRTLNPNLVEGRELWRPTGIAFDTSTSPPIVYVADTLNNRVLAWKNSAGFSNGAPADLIIGQPDQYTTTPSGPNTNFTTGLTDPTGLAVYKGDLYVADSGNNRVLRYKAPFAQFAQTGSYPTPDLFVGQPSLKSAKVDYPSGSPTAQGLSFSSGGSVLLAGIAFDTSGNMWVTDPGNRRVLEFNAADVANGGGLLTAAVELGQLNFVTLQTPLSPGNVNSQLIKNQFAVPSQLIFDAAGNLYVSDADATSPANLSRVLVFAPPFASGQAAARIMGVVEPSQIASLGIAQQQAVYDNTGFVNPGGIFLLADSSVGVVDTNDNRILIFSPYSTWPAATTYVSPQATGVLGQNGSFQAFGVNGTTSFTVVTPPASAGVFSGPLTAAVLPSTSELFVVDTGNNRVVVMPQQSGTVQFGNATRVLGQDTMTMNSANLIEGREFQFYNGGATADAGIALDTSGSVPHLYVADPYNHRVLGFYDARKLYATGVPEGQQGNNEIVIGEPDFNTAICNYPSGDLTKTTASGLCDPRGVLTDANGNLYVADTGNARVVRFPAPFANWPQTQVMQPADLVLGQTSLTGAPITDPSAVHMAAPYGLAFTGTSGLMVSDVAYNRVLYIPFSSGQTTFNAPADNGKAATKVYGQPDFVTVTAGSAVNQLNSPHHIAADTSGQVYITDSGNGRVEIFSDPNNPLTPPTSADAILTLPGLTGPQGIYVSPLTGEIWVTTASTAVRYPKYDTLQLNPASTGTVQAADTTLAVAQDQYGDLFLADATSRVAVYYQGLSGGNAQSSYLGQPLAPGVVASLYSKASQTQFATPSIPTPPGFASLTGYPMPITLADEQVLFNGVPAPLYFVSPSQVNFFVPMEAPVTGSADVEIVQLSTGQVLAASSLIMEPVSPAIFCGAQGGCLTNGAFYQAAVLNQDFSVNSPTNPAARGSIIQIFCTGQGALNNPPADGAAAGTSPLSWTPQTPRVAIGTSFVDDGPVLPGDPTNGQWVTYSGLAPGYAGLWQINVFVPMRVLPGAQVPIGIQYDGVGSSNLSSLFHLSIAVK
ncbi:MAG: hypothetical protein ABSE42_17975 [Bryobacteraceae bacterium]|jgi:uncharacterized protein (TIGR03437 family)